MEYFAHGFLYFLSFFKQEKVFLVAISIEIEVHTHLLVKIKFAKCYFPPKNECIFPQSRMCFFGCWMFWQTKKNKKWRISTKFQPF